MNAETGRPSLPRQRAKQFVAATYPMAGLFCIPLHTNSPDGLNVLSNTFETRLENKEGDDCYRKIK